LQVWREMTDWSEIGLLRGSLCGALRSDLDAVRYKERLRGCAQQAALITRTL
jgi:hypothetical protein